MNDISNICVYCGKYAYYQLKNGKWCCSMSHNTCPSMKRKNSIKNKGKKFSDEHKKKISNSKKGLTPWNKGKIGLQVAWNKGKKLPKLSQEHKQKISEATSLEKNGNWKGGYWKRDVASYKYFCNKLTIEEDPKRDTLDSNIVTVMCTKCKKRFIPTFKAAYERYRSLNLKNHGEQRLYCSNNCKNNCSIFGKHNYQEDHPNKDNKLYTPSEYKQFREYVLERDNGKCQYCGEKAEHVHHERPQKLEPFFALDPDYAWSCCKKCHYKYGHRDECSTNEISKRICT